MIDENALGCYDERELGSETECTEVEEYGDERRL